VVLIMTLSVVKVGGSLFDLPDLGRRLDAFLRRLPFPPSPILLVPGGGTTADVVRAMDRCHRLGEERAHWLALFSLSLNARFLAELLPQAEVVEAPEDAATVQARGGVAVLDAHSFALADEGRPGALPHRWEVTSDSVAARVAVASEATRLVLVKSTNLPPGLGWTEAGRRGLVDAYFAQVVTGTNLEVGWVNLRDGWP
jgi:5-(aminomethyl)-3-furanmethanol phosphate kinase